MAWSSLGKHERDFVVEEIATCEADPRYYLENYHVIKPEKGLAAFAACHDDTSSTISGAKSIAC